MTVVVVAVVVAVVVVVVVVDVVGVVVVVVVVGVVVVVVVVAVVVVCCCCLLLFMWSGTHGCWGCSVFRPPVDEDLFKLRWFGGSGGGGGPAAEFRSQMIPIMLEANTIRLRKGRGGRSGGRVPQPNDKAKKAQGPPLILGMLGFRIICNPRIAKISNSHFAADGAGGGGGG